MTEKMHAAKCCMEQGHSDQFGCVLSDLESIFDLGCPEKKSKLTHTKKTKKMRAAKCCIEQGHVYQFECVLSDSESIFDLACPENSR